MILAFSLHCNLCSTVMLAQILMYPGDGQRVTPVCWASTGGIFLVPHDSWIFICHIASSRGLLVVEEQTTIGMLRGSVKLFS